MPASRAKLHCPLHRILLAPTQLDDRLPAAQCPTCGGQWVHGSHYWNWVNAHGRDHGPQPGDPSVILPAHDSPAAKLCPECGRFLTHVRVGHGLDFSIDRCSACSGLWLDADEWQALKSRGLHDHVHQMFSSVWQAEVAQQEREKLHEQTLLEKLGPEALAEIKRIKLWLESHPRRAELYAFLLHSGGDSACRPAE